MRRSLKKNKGNGLYSEWMEPTPGKVWRPKEKQRFRTRGYLPVWREGTGENSNSKEDPPKGNSNEEEKGRMFETLPKEIVDPGRFVLEIKLGSVTYAALCDTGADLNTLPIELVPKMNLGMPHKTDIRMSNADGSLMKTHGIMNGLTIYIGRHAFPGDFIVQDTRVDDDVPVILGR